jgi:putative membrane protein
MWLWWLLILIGVVAIAVGLTWAGRRGAGRDDREDRRGPRPPVSTARQILDERFARGEIDEEEYRVRRRELDA